MIPGNDVFYGAAAYQQAKLAGRLACADGYLKSENPYPADTREYDAWRHGWIAEAEAEVIIMHSVRSVAA